MNNNRRKFLQLSASSLLYPGLGINSVAADTSQVEQTHFPPLANRVIFLNMRGAPSHLDTFDYKPELQKAHNKTGKFGRRLMASPWEFKQHGESGLWLSALFPHLSKHADDLCLINGMYTDQPNHPQAQTKMHTGNFQFARPSLGSWLIYGLPNKNPQIPGFITINPSAGTSAHYSNAFLPNRYRGTALKGGSRNSSGSRIADISSPRLDFKNQRKQLDFIQQLNKHHLQRSKYSPDTKGIVDSYEMAYDMQSTMPQIMDISQEKESTKELYGLNNNESSRFGSQCLTARRFAEAGARFIELTHNGWDHHFNLKNSMENRCKEIDKPIAGLIQDLKQRSMLKDTLIIWSGEFGRTPESANSNGRDHNFRGFSSWMAGAGTKGGTRYGSTDELGYQAVDDRMSIHDWHATILHIMGLDHRRLTYKYAGRNFRLTDVYGNVAKNILK